jgi:uncharacterized protein (TIGR03086 family)
MDPVADAERSYRIAEQVIAGVRPEQLGQSTPCTEWDVRTLMNHIILGHYYFAGALQGEEMDPHATPPDFAAGDPVGAFEQGSRRMLEAWREPGAFDRTVQTMIGPMPAAVLVRMHTMDNLVHAWDLARATGQDENLDAELATQILDLMRQNNPPRGEGSPFGPEQPAAPGATPEQQLAAFLGRRI